MSNDQIRQESERIADMYLPMTAPQRDGARELALTDDPGVNAARDYVKPHTQAFLDRVIRDACRGGRNSDWGCRIMAWLTLGFQEKADINLFMARLGASETEARGALDAVRRVKSLDEREAIEVSARFLGRYLEKNPVDRDRILELMGVKAA